MRFRDLLCDSDFCCRVSLVAGPELFFSPEVLAYDLRNHGDSEKRLPAGFGEIEYMDPWHNLFSTRFQSPFDWLKNIEIRRKNPIHNKHLGLVDTRTLFFV